MKAEMEREEFCKAVRASAKEYDDWNLGLWIKMLKNTPTEHSAMMLPILQEELRSRKEPTHENDQIAAQESR